MECVDGAHTKWVNAWLNRWTFFLLCILVLFLKGIWWYLVCRCADGCCYCLSFSICTFKICSIFVLPLLLILLAVIFFLCAAARSFNYSFVHVLNNNESSQWVDDNMMFKCLTCTHDSSWKTHDWVAAARKDKERAKSNAYKHHWQKLVWVNFVDVKWTKMN